MWGGEGPISIWKGYPTSPVLREAELESEPLTRRHPLSLTSCPPTYCPEPATSWIEGDPCGAGSNHSQLGSFPHQTSKQLM